MNDYDKGYEAGLENGHEGGFSQGYDDGKKFAQKKVLDFDIKMEIAKSCALFFVYTEAAGAYSSLSILFSFPQCGQNIFFLG